MKVFESIIQNDPDFKHLDPTLAGFNISLLAASKIDKKLVNKFDKMFNDKLGSRDKKRFYKSLDAISKASSNLAGEIDEKHLDYTLSYEKPLILRPWIKTKQIISLTDAHGFSFTEKLIRPNKLRFVLDETYDIETKKPKAGFATIKGDYSATRIKFEPFEPKRLFLYGDMTKVATINSVEVENDRYSTSKEYGRTKHNIYVANDLGKWNVQSVTYTADELDPNKGFIETARKFVELTNQEAVFIIQSLNFIVNYNNEHKTVISSGSIIEPTKKTIHTIVNNKEDDDQPKA